MIGLTFFSHKYYTGFPFEQIKLTIFSSNRLVIVAVSTTILHSSSYDKKQLACSFKEEEYLTINTYVAFT